VKKLFKHFKSSVGFTLIELLIVIAILGVLSAVVLVAINPVEQLAKTRDSGRIETVSSIGHAIQQYYTTQSSLPVVATWNTAIQTSGDVATNVTLPSGASHACTTNAKSFGGGSVCYNIAGNGTDFTVWTNLESGASNVRAGGGAACGSGTYPMVVYDSSAGKAGLVCAAAGSAISTGGTLN